MNVFPLLYFSIRQRRAHGFFAGTKGLRQGDPMSPYLFVLVMEVFLGLMGNVVHNNGCISLIRAS